MPPPALKNSGGGNSATGSTQVSFSNNNVSYAANDDMDDELDEAWYEKLNGSETMSYFLLMNYLIIWIDRWAHDIVDPSKVPEESKKHIMEYGGIKKYHNETDLDQRTTLLTRDDLNNPECLNPMWELFLMCEDEILDNEFFEVDEDYNVKMKGVKAIDIIL